MEDEAPFTSCSFLSFLDEDSIRPRKLLRRRALGTSAASDATVVMGSGEGEGEANADGGGAACLNLGSGLGVMDDELRREKNGGAPAAEGGADDARLADFAPADVVAKEEEADVADVPLDPANALGGARRVGRAGGDPTTGVWVARGEERAGRELRRVFSGGVGFGRGRARAIELADVVRDMGLGWPNV